MPNQYSSMPHGYAGAQFFGDPRMQIGFRQGENASPYANVQGRRVSPYGPGYFGAQQQQQFAQQGLYQGGPYGFAPAMGPGYNRASFLTRLAFAGGMGQPVTYALIAAAATYVLTVVVTAWYVREIRRDADRFTERQIARAYEQLARAYDENKELAHRLMHLSGHTWRMPSERDIPYEPVEEPIVWDPGPEMSDV